MKSAQRRGLRERRAKRVGVAPKTINAETATLTTFRINTCKSVSKQMTLTPFRINTYTKTGGGGPPTHYPLLAAHCLLSQCLQLRRRPSHTPRGASIPCALTRLRILPVTTGVYSTGLQTFRHSEAALKTLRPSNFPTHGIIAAHGISKYPERHRPLGTSAPSSAASRRARAGA